MKFTKMSKDEFFNLMESIDPEENKEGVAKDPTESEIRYTKMHDVLAKQLIKLEEAREAKLKKFNDAGLILTSTIMDKLSVDLFDNITNQLLSFCKMQEALIDNHTDTPE